jgi:hypothetical protein
MQHAEPPIQLSFIEAQLYEALRQATPEQQAELRALAASQSLAAFTRTLQQRFPPHAQYITEARVANVLAYDRQQQAVRPAPVQEQAVNVPAPAPAPTYPPAQAASRKRGFTYHFHRSTWITAIWNWFLMLASKAAEPVLTISVIYSCARLLPAIHTPVPLDNTIFICQMIALDIGGLGLRKLANQARKDGNEDGARLAGSVSTALLTIMGINVALSVLESVAPLDPTVERVIEGILLIARAIMAVFYAYVIHSLHGEGGEPHDEPHAQPDLQQAVADLQTTFEQRLAEIVAEQSRMLASMQQMPHASPEIDQQAIIAAVVAQVETRLTTVLKRLETDMKRVSVSAVPETGQSGTAIAGPKLVPLPARSVSSRAPKPPALEQEAAQAVQRKTGETGDCKAVVYALLEQDNTRQVADIARETGYPKTTVWRHWNRYHEEHGTRGQARMVESETVPAATSETAS